MQANNSIPVLKALADKTRLDIVRTIASQPNKSCSCSFVSVNSKLSQPAMSHHFSKLVDAGVLTESKNGTEKSYKLNLKLLQDIGINPDKL